MDKKREESDLISHNARNREPKVVYFLIIYQHLIFSKRNCDCYKIDCVKLKLVVIIKSVSWVQNSYRN